uniref:Exonuclease domain-containing protein n=1 Tax=Calidris pygmaea TaxID=425635 RepID=A0A8C3JVP4_9CHAR
MVGVGRDRWRSVSPTPLPKQGHPEQYGGVGGCMVCFFKVSTRKRPCVPESGSKVPFETRQRYVSCFFAECLKTCSTVHEAIHKAQLEEQSVYEHCSSKKMYLNFAVKTLKKLRDLLFIFVLILRRLWVYLQHLVVGFLAFTDGALYELLKDYLLTEEQLNENNFPRPNPEKNGSAILTGVVKNAGYDGKSFKRVCCRCGEVYTVTSSGEHRRKEECNYHSGRVLEQRVPGGMEKRYRCCERIVGSSGCQIAKLHVHDGRSNKLEGFMKTLPKSPPFDGNYGVYALDCETCYTTHGLELTRVTVVDAKLQVVYDTFVKPDGKVVDYDIRLSGAKEDDLKNTTTSLRDVQAVLLNLFSADTIVIGHSLENGLFTLKLIHDTVVDTSVVFPHRLGLPHKRPLASLMADYLRRIHQDDGKSSDAIACMELILWKVKEDNKKRKR